ncbi:hypothetical protein NSMM_460004 [Nitrosomonas mobilis]|uniref:Uncharacterized protein n=1 Tax=Nitrosomonas mobilis TaxID=51642 RepID=A0A1G5SH88_9PROT|nr:hypothetical protein NSMM_460004 [Nitrosomonas mobilis]
MEAVDWTNIDTIGVFAFDTTFSHYISHDDIPRLASFLKESLILSEPGNACHCLDDLLRAGQISYTKVSANQNLSCFPRMTHKIKQ